MAINEWGIWKKLKIVKETETEEVKVKEDLRAIVSFLKEIDVSKLVEKLEIMKGMVKEEVVVGKELKIDNLKKQIELLDEILRDYNFFQDDADINGLRLKKIGGELLKKAKEKEMADLVKDKKKDILWR